MVEGGLIDWASHARDGGSLGSEMIELDQAVQAAYAWGQVAKRHDRVHGGHETGDLALRSTTNIVA